MAQRLLDEEVVEELQEVMADQFTHLCTRFISDATSRLAAMESAICAHDSLTLKQQAHSLKGASSNLGAMRLVDQCQQMEGLAETHSWEKAAELLAEARHTAIALEQALSDYLE